MTDILSLQLNAPIIPNEELGGLKLRTKIVDVQELVTGLGLYKSGSYKLTSPFEARYTLENGEIEVAVDVRNGKIFKLIAGQGYQGLLFSKISVGLLVQDALTFEPDLYYNEAEEAILHKNCDGVVIDVPEIDPFPDLVPKLNISAISVFAVEIYKNDGQKGYW